MGPGRWSAVVHAAVWGIGIIDVDGGCIRCRREGVLMASRSKLLEGVKTLLTMIVSCRVNWVKVGQARYKGRHSHSRLVVSLFAR